MRDMPTYLFLSINSVFNVDIRKSDKFKQGIENAILCVPEFLHNTQKSLEN